MTSRRDLIWILDTDPHCLATYKQLLGSTYEIKCFESLGALASEIMNLDAPQCHLLIVDPANVTGPLNEVLGSAPELRGRYAISTMIVSHDDGLEQMRFFMKLGARDYVLKPMRPTEIMAKVERAMCQPSNREVLILRNDLDGHVVDDLTFREQQILTVLISRPKRQVSRNDLYDAVWGKNLVNRKTLDVHLFNLRRKLRPMGYDIINRDGLFCLVNPIATAKNTESETT